MSRPLPLPHRKPQPASQGAAMTAPDVAEIARGLTKAQRAALWNWPHPAYVRGLAPHDGFSRGGQAMQSLARIGLACRVGRGMWMVNDKAIAVRTYLQENPDA